MATASSGLASGQCRCCLKHGSHRKLTDTCDIHGQTKVYSELFMDCFNLDMATNIKLSDLICTSCICRLNDAVDFKSQVAESEQQLLSQITDDIKTVPFEAHLLGEVNISKIVFLNFSADHDYEQTLTDEEPGDVKEEPDDDDEYPECDDDEQLCKLFFY
ncbi:hypothetical protein O0L34_g11982 [Tuta absoluta]|nr:hypothetical protein O0L34_g11982 [Tuta absoluta]